MKLYRISQDVNTGYDTYDSAVVCANSEAEARTMHPAGNVVWQGEKWVYEDNEEEYWSYNWTEPQGVKVELIGKADKSIAKGVIVASFNAG